jgi:hypothetical protein
MRKSSAVRIFESELEVITDEVYAYPDIETGGNLFGLFSHGRVPVIFLATRPAGQVRREVAALELDPQVQRLLEEHLWGRFGIQCVGMWHSHHRIGLFEPSGGDQRRTANYAAKWQRTAYTEILANYLDTGGGAGGDPHDASGRRHQEKKHRGRRRGRDHEARILLTPFVYTDAVKLIRAHASIQVLPGCSPVRAAIQGNVPAQLADALRPADPRYSGEYHYELGVSPDRSGGSAFAPGRPPGAAAVAEGRIDDGTDSRADGPAVAADRRVAGQAPAGQQPDSPAMASHQTADHGGRNELHDIPDMVRYTEEYIGPLLRLWAGTTNNIAPVNQGMLELVLEDEGQRELRMVFGWDGARPVVVKYRIRKNWEYSKWFTPDQKTCQDLRAVFLYGVKEMGRGGWS